MRLLDIISLSLKNTIRTKTSILVMILVVVISSSFLFSMSYQSSFNKYWVEYQNNNPEFRIRSISYFNKLDSRVQKQDENMSIYEKKNNIENVSNETYNLLKSNKHVIGIASEQFFRTRVYINEYVNNEHDGLMEIIGIPNNNKINIIKGRNIENSNELLCPNTITASSKIDNKSNYNVNELINIEKDIGKKIHLKIENENIDSVYEIVGLYDTSSNYSIGNTCYANYDTLEKLIKKYYQINPEIEQSVINYQNSQYYTGDNIYIMIDDINSMPELNKLFQENDLMENPIININTSTVDEIIGICKYITLFSLALTIIILILTIICNIHKRNNELNSFKLVGYKKNDILKIIFCENSLLIVIGYLLSIIIVNIGLIIYKNMNLINKSRLYLMNPSIDLYYTCCILLLLLIIPIILTIVFSIYSERNSIIKE